MSENHIDVFYKNYWSRLCKKLHSRFGSGPPDPEDIAQQAFIKYYQMPNYNQAEHPEALVFTIARNLFIDSYRKQDKQQAVIDSIFDELNLDPIVEHSAEFNASSIQSIEHLEKALANLNDKQKQLVALHIVDGLTYRTIAQQTGFSMGDISRTINSAIQLIHQVVKDSEQTEYSHTSRLSRSA